MNVFPNISWIPTYPAPSFNNFEHVTRLVSSTRFFFLIHGVLPSGSCSWCFLEERRGIGRSGNLRAKSLPSWKRVNCHQLESPLMVHYSAGYWTPSRRQGRKEEGRSFERPGRTWQGGMLGGFPFLEHFPPTVWFYWNSSEWQERRLCEDNCPFRRTTPSQNSLEVEQTLVENNLYNPIASSARFI